MIRKLFEEQRPLMVAGTISLALFALMAILSQLDPTLILGISRWIKPMKFFISIAIFLGTIAIYLRYLNGQRLGKWLAWGFISIMVIEMLIITGQSVRGTTSHFNNSTPLDSALFTIMGTAIAGSTVLTAIILYRYLRTDVLLPRSIAWGMRLGLIVFILGSIEGGYMAQHASHTVGAADGGPGLPLANWSTLAGDLRVAHFLGLHALQAIPLFSYFAYRLKAMESIAPTVVFAIAYFAIFTFVFIQALMGRPFLTF